VKLSVVMPAHNEEGCVEDTVTALVQRLEAAGEEWEIVVVDDHCTDDTAARVGRLAAAEPRIVMVRNQRVGGYGMAVRRGLEAFTGDAVVVVMADGSDDPDDVLLYAERLRQGAECVFGTRFARGSRLIDYPAHKLVLNRLANWIIRGLFRHGLNDTTNAFKAYRREVIEGCQPLLAVHFNLTVELPLKAVIRGYRYEVVPISWRNRTSGVSKLRIREVGSRYVFIILYCFLERLLAGADYRRSRATPKVVGRPAVSEPGRR
jgi:dolichol-phosphate mannosyltransferase